MPITLNIISWWYTSYTIILTSYTQNLKFDIFRPEGFIFRVPLKSLFPIDLFKYLLNRCFWHLRTTHEIMLDTSVSRVSRWVRYKIQFWGIIGNNMKKTRYRKVGFPASGFYFSGTTKTVSIMIWHIFLLNPRNKDMENYNALKS